MQCMTSLLCFMQSGRHSIVRLQETFHLGDDRRSLTYESVYVQRNGTDEHTTRLHSGSLITSHYMTCMIRACTIHDHLQTMLRHYTIIHLEGSLFKCISSLCKSCFLTRRNVKPLSVKRLSRFQTATREKKREIKKKVEVILFGKTQAVYSEKNCSYFIPFKSCVYRCLFLLLEYAMLNEF